MEVKKDLIGKKTLSKQKIAKKHNVSLAKIQQQLAKGAKVEREHTKSDAEAKEIARDHLAEIPDYYTRLKKMEREAGVKEAYVDPLETLHNANRERILKGAREGKFWLIRSEGVDESHADPKYLVKGPKTYDNGSKPKYGRSSGGQNTSVLTGPLGPETWSGVSGALGEEDRRQLIARIIETTMTSNIGGFNMPMVGNKNDLAFGGRNKVAPAMRKNAEDWLTKIRSKRHPAARVIY